MSESLKDLILVIRSAKTSAQESTIINKEIAKLKSTESSSLVDLEEKIDFVSKLIYFEMLGHPTSFGQMEILTLTASPLYSQKRIGYLGLSSVFTEDSKTLLLAVQQIKKDASNNNSFFSAIALQTLGNIGSFEMLSDLSTDILRFLSHQNVYIRKRAILCGTRIVKRIPEVAESFEEIAFKFLNWKNHSGLGALVSLLSQSLESSFGGIKKISNSDFNFHKSFYEENEKGGNRERKINEFKKHFLSEEERNCFIMNLESLYSDEEESQNEGRWKRFRKYLSGIKKLTEHTINIIEHRSHSYRVKGVNNPFLLNKIISLINNILCVLLENCKFLLSLYSAFSTKQNDNNNNNNNNKNNLVKKEITEMLKKYSTEFKKLREVLRNYYGSIIVNIDNRRYTGKSVLVRAIEGVFMFAQFLLVQRNIVSLRSNSIENDCVEEVKRKSGKKKGTGGEREASESELNKKELRLFKCSLEIVKQFLVGKSVDVYNTMIVDNNVRFVGLKLLSNKYFNPFFFHSNKVDSSDSESKKGQKGIRERKGSVDKKKSRKESIEKDLEKVTLAVKEAVILCLDDFDVSVKRMALKSLLKFSHSNMKLVSEENSKSKKGREENKEIIHNLTKKVIYFYSENDFYLSSNKELQLFGKELFNATLNLILDSSKNSSEDVLSLLERVNNLTEEVGFNFKDEPNFSPSISEKNQIKVLRIFDYKKFVEKEKVQKIYFEILKNLGKTNSHDFFFVFVRVLSNMKKSYFDLVCGAKNDNDYNNDYNEEKNVMGKNSQKQNGEKEQSLESLIMEDFINGYEKDIKTIHNDGGCEGYRSDVKYLELLILKIFENLEKLYIHLYSDMKCNLEKKIVLKKLKFRYEYESKNSFAVYLNGLKNVYHFSKETRNKIENFLEKYLVCGL